MRIERVKGFVQARRAEAQDRTFSGSRLASGVRVVCAPVPGARSLAVLVGIGVGSRYEAGKQSGLAHLIEHMLFKGTRRRPSARLVAEPIDRVGGQLNAFTTKEFTGYWAHCAAEHSELALDLVCDLLSDPLIDAAELESEKDVVVQELRTLLETPALRCRYLWDGLLHDGGPLGRMIVGTEESIRSIRRDDIVDFIGRFYRGRRVVIGLAGAVSRSFLPRLELLTSALAGSGEGGFAPATFGPKRVACTFRDAPQAQFAVGVPGLALDDADRYTLTVLDSLLDGGMSGRLFSEVRERRGLAYAISTVRQDYLDGGGYYAQAGVQPDRIGESVAAVLGEFSRLAGARASQAELEKARSYAKGELVLTLEQPLQLLRFGVLDELLEGRAREPEEILAGIDAVTAADVERLARRLFRTDALRLAVVGPFDDPAHFEPLLELP